MNYVRIEIDNGTESKDIIVEHTKFCAAMDEVEEKHGGRAERVLELLERSAIIRDRDLVALVEMLKDNKVRSNSVSIGMQIVKAIGEDDVTDKHELRISSLRDFPFAREADAKLPFYEFMQGDHVLYAVSPVDLHKAVSHLERFGYPHAATILRYLPNNLTGDGITAAEAKVLCIAANATQTTRRVLIGKYLKAGMHIRPKV